jgi:hypothetical protein
MADILAVTLPYNRHHFSEVLIVTTQEDIATHAVAFTNNAGVLATPSFYGAGASFAKFRAIEEGLDSLGRRGWLCLMDADVCWPKDLNLLEEYYHLTTRLPQDIWLMHRKQPLIDGLRFGFLYSGDGRWIAPEDTIFNAPCKPPPERSWASFKPDPTNGPDGSSPHSECIGYSQIFHADDEALGTPPWHDITLPNCAKGDSLFQARWPLSRKVWLPFKVLHIGEPNLHWDGKKGKPR